tara:strand:+ start:293 stop:448 length:156 start_codon:yes stop_codon:yes gene_type:complete
MTNKVEEYVREKYPRLFKPDAQLFIEENESVFFISSNKDQSPIIISKQSLL